MFYRSLFIVLIFLSFCYSAENIYYEHAFHIQSGFAFDIYNENGYDLSLSYERRIKKGSLEFGIRGAGYFDSYEQNGGNTTFLFEGKDYNAESYKEIWRDYTVEIFVLINHRMDIIKYLKNRAIIFNLWQYGFTFNFYVFGENITDLNYTEFYSTTENKIYRHTFGTTYRPSFGMRLTDRIALTIEGAAGFGIPIFNDHYWWAVNGIYGIGLGLQFFK